MTSLNFLVQLLDQFLILFGGLFISVIFLFQLLFELSLFRLSPLDKLKSGLYFFVDNDQFGLAITNKYLVFLNGQQVLSLFLLESSFCLILRFSPLGNLRSEVVDVLLEQINNLFDFGMVDFFTTGGQLSQSQGHLELSSGSFLKHFLSFGESVFSLLYLGQRSFSSEQTLHRFYTLFHDPDPFLSIYHLLLKLLVLIVTSGFQLQILSF